MKTTTYIETLTNAGVDARIAHAHGKAMEHVIDDTFVTRDALRDILDPRMGELRASIYQAMFLQAIAIIGLTTALAKLFS